MVVALAATSLVADALRELAPVYGFGFVDDGRRSRARRERRGGGGSVAGYLTGYLNGASKVEAVVAAVDEGVIPHRSWYLAAWLTRRGGLNMRLCRRVRRWWAASVGLLEPPADTGCGLLARLSGWIDRAPPILLRPLPIAA